MQRFQKVVLKELSEITPEIRDAVLLLSGDFSLKTSTTTDKAQKSIESVKNETSEGLRFQNENYKLGVTRKFFVVAELVDIGGNDESMDSLSFRPSITSDIERVPKGSDLALRRVVELKNVSITTLKSKIIVVRYSNGTRQEFRLKRKKKTGEAVPQNPASDLKSRWRLWTNVTEWLKHAGAFEGENKSLDSAFLSTKLSSSSSWGSSAGFMAFDAREIFNPKRSVYVSRRMGRFPPHLRPWKSVNDLRVFVPESYVFVHKDFEGGGSIRSRYDQIIASEMNLVKTGSRLILGEGPSASSAANFESDSSPKLSFFLSGENPGQRSSGNLNYNANNDNNDDNLRKRHWRGRVKEECERTNQRRRSDSAPASRYRDPIARETEVERWKEDWKKSRFHEETENDGEIQIKKTNDGDDDVARNLRHRFSDALRRIFPFAKRENVESDKIVESEKVAVDSIAEEAQSVSSSSMSSSASNSVQQNLRTGNDETLNETDNCGRARRWPSSTTDPSPYRTDRHKVGVSRNFRCFDGNDNSGFLRVKRSTNALCLAENEHATEEAKEIRMMREWLGKDIENPMKFFALTLRQFFVVKKRKRKRRILNSNNNNFNNNNSNSIYSYSDFSGRRRSWFQRRSKKTERDLASDVMETDEENELVKEAYEIFPFLPPALTEAEVQRLPNDEGEEDVMEADESWLSFARLSPAAIANELTIITRQLFLDIEPREMFCFTKEAYPNVKFSPCLLRAIDFFDRIACLTASEVIRGATPEDRALVIDKWLKVAEELEGARSFQALAAIITGLQLLPIRRMEETWNVLQRKSSQNFDTNNSNDRMMRKPDSGICSGRNARKKYRVPVAEGRRSQNWRSSNRNENSVLEEETSGDRQVAFRPTVHKTTFDVMSMSMASTNPDNVKYETDKNGLQIEYGPDGKFRFGSYELFEHLSRALSDDDNFVFYRKNWSNVSPTDLESIPEDTRPLQPGVPFLAPLVIDALRASQVEDYIETQLMDDILTDMTNMLLYAISKVMVEQYLMSEVRLYLEGPDTPIPICCCLRACQKQNGQKGGLGEKCAFSGCCKKDPPACFLSLCNSFPCCPSCKTFCVPCCRCSKCCTQRESLLRCCDETSCWANKCGAPCGRFGTRCSLTSKCCMAPPPPCCVKTCNPLADHPQAFPCCTCCRLCCLPRCRCSRCCLEKDFVDPFEISDQPDYLLMYYWRNILLTDLYLKENITSIYY